MKRQYPLRFFLFIPAHNQNHGKIHGISSVCSVYTHRRVRNIRHKNAGGLRARFEISEEEEKTHPVSAGSAVQQDLLLFTISSAEVKSTANATT